MFINILIYTIEWIIIINQFVFDYNLNKYINNNLLYIIIPDLRNEMPNIDSYNNSNYACISVHIFHYPACTISVII